MAIKPVKKPFRIVLHNDSRYGYVIGYEFVRELNRNMLLVDMSGNEKRRTVEELKQLVKSRNPNTIWLRDDEVIDEAMVEGGSAWWGG